MKNASRDTISYKTWAAASALFALASIASLTSGCSFEPSSASSGTAGQELSTTEAGCFDWSNVNKTLTGGGEFVTAATYTNGTCFKAYLLNLVDYRGDIYNGGAAVGYGGAIPTTESECTQTRVRAVVWRRDGTNMVLEGDKTASGHWIVGFDGVARCLPPIVNLESDIGIVPDGTKDYRVAMTARAVPGTEGATVPVAFVTVQNHTISPLGEMNNAVAYKQVLDSYSGSNLEPWLKAAWNTRSTPAGQVACRHLQVDRGLHAFTRAALIKAGGTAATVDARNTALTNFSNALCTTAGTTANLYSSLKDYVTRTINLRDEISNALLAEMPAAYQVTRDSLSANLLSQIPAQALGSLISKCDLRAGPVMNYILNGVLPSGVSDATRVVLGGCSSQTPAQAATGIRFGTTPSGGPSNGVRAMAACMAGLASGVTLNRCSDTRAEGAPETPKNTCRTVGGKIECQPGCWDDLTGKPCDAAAGAQHEQVKATTTSQGQKVESTAVQKIRGSNSSDGGVIAAVGQLVQEKPKLAAGAIAGTLGVMADAAKWVVNRQSLDPSVTSDEARNLKTIASDLEGVGVVLKAVGVAFVVAEVFDAIDGYMQTDAENAADEASVRAWCEQKPADPLGRCDGFNGPQSYCPPDEVMPQNGWYELGTGGPTAHQANIQDLFEHCMCEMVDADYDAIGKGQAPSRAPSFTCPKSKEQRKLDCVADPRLGASPTDGPDPECYNLLAPVYDADAWKSRDCWAKQCGANQGSFRMPDGTCQCQTINPGQGIPDCRITPFASAGLCPAEAPNNCFCSPLDPLPPNGNDPFCRQNITRPPGPLSSWALPDTDAIHVGVFDSTTSALRVRAGGNTQFVSPTLFPNSFSQRGTQLRQKVVLYKAPAVGQNVDLKLYYSNRSRNIHREFLGQCRMNSFSVGALSNCDFPMPTINGANASTFEEPFEIEMELNTATGYTTRPALAGISFVGTLTNTPTAKLAPTCNPPSSGGKVVDVLSPWIRWLDTINPNQTYTLPSGTLLELPLNISVAR